MRPFALAVVFLSLAGCKSGGERPDRDYTSVNKRSVDFVFECFREGNKIRKKNLKQDLAFSKRAPQNRMIRKTSVAFAWQSFWVEEWAGISQIKQGLKAESVPVSERLAQMRFGFLDSGS